MNGNIYITDYSGTIIQVTDNTNKISVESWEEREKAEQEFRKNFDMTFDIKIMYLEEDEDAICSSNLEKNNARMLSYRSRALSKRSFAIPCRVQKRLYKNQRR